MVTAHQWKLQPFLTWTRDVFLPRAKIGTGPATYALHPGGSRPALYGTADAACILYSIGALDTGPEAARIWLDELGAYQCATSGYFVATTPSLATAHNTGFAVAAMNLFQAKLTNGVLPKHPLSFASLLHDTKDAARFIDSLDWRTNCYEAGEITTGLASTFVNVGGVVPTTWVPWFMRYCEDTKLDPSNGMMGVDKPFTGDLDQIGGTFHFDFLWASQKKTLPLALERATALLNLQRTDGLWDAHNPWWLTFDAVYMLGRALPELPATLKPTVTAAIERAVDTLATRAHDETQRKADFVDAWMGVHMLTGAVSFFAYAQRVLGAEAVVTDTPLRLVLDRRPYI